MCLCLFLLHYLFKPLHLCAFDKPSLGFLLKTMGMGCCFFLFHLRVTFISPPISNWSILTVTIGITCVLRRESPLRLWGTFDGASCDHYARWLLLLWNHEQSPCGQLECFLMLACERACSPYYHPSLSILPLVLG